MPWKLLAPPPDVLPPSPMTMRAQAIPPGHGFADHFHEWNQMVYAISGVLTVVAEGRSFLISPDQAAWLPTGTLHRVGSFLGAEFRSLWIGEDVGGDLFSRNAAVFTVTPLLRALIIEAAAIDGEADSGEADDHEYRGRVRRLIVDQLRRARSTTTALPWPKSIALSQLCEVLYADPADPRSIEEWGASLGMSGRTLARRFLVETGTSLRSWRRRLRLFRAVELLESGMDVTRTAMELGYGSTSAFTYAFRTEMRRSPQAYMREIDGCRERN
ncbi:helix-turn-helix transcriptional regulator [Pusillimonas sp. SM2304]|uniref:AraC family transcriptional regulator n=1 Tax=Pusillimonas sp. SM2304 TaxID=3073241 RepID=UPI002876F5A1|nr:helix-turn-helix transcriptional regulator [Pusillimonas sp. SM2304]MDS1141057.1 helix-turn-helix transcriptional regulator [Pusillimonas sp. SM2304]